MLKTCVLGLTLTALIAGGCSSSRVGGTAKAYTPDSTVAAELLPGVATWDAALPGDFTAPEDDLARRDATLNPQRPEPMLASTQWPHAPQPSFERPWRVHLPRQPEDVLHFRTPGNPRPSAR